MDRELYLVITSMEAELARSNLPFATRQRINQWHVTLQNIERKLLLMEK